MRRGREELGAASGESALALPAPLLRPGSFLARFQHNVTCTEGLPQLSRTHSEVLLSSLAVCDLVVCFVFLPTPLWNSRVLRAGSVLSHPPPTPGTHTEPCSNVLCRQEGTPLALGADGSTGANRVPTSGIWREQVQSGPHNCLCLYGTPPS